MRSVCSMYAVASFWSHVYTNTHTRLNVLTLSMQKDAWVCQNMHYTLYRSVCACRHPCVYANVREGNIKCTFLHKCRRMCFVMHTGTMRYKGLFRKFLITFTVLLELGFFQKQCYELGTSYTNGTKARAISSHVIVMICSFHRDYYFIHYSFVKEIWKYPWMQQPETKGR